MHTFSMDNWKQETSLAYTVSLLRKIVVSLSLEQSTQQFGKSEPSECPIQTQSSPSKVVIPDLQVSCVMNICKKDV